MFMTNKQLKTGRELNAAGEQRRTVLKGAGMALTWGALASVLGATLPRGVRADGAIVPCTMLAHMELGRINQDPLLEVWQQSSALDQLRRRRTIPLTEYEFCAGCPYTSYCTGNCPGLAYTLTGTVDHPSPDACLRRFLEEGGSLA